MFILKNGAENTGYVSDRGMLTTTTGQILVTIATQTADVVVQENPDILQANLPHTQNLSSIYHGSWPLTKGNITQSVFHISRVMIYTIYTIHGLSSKYQESWSLTKGNITQPDLHEPWVVFQIPRVVVSN